MDSALVRKLPEEFLSSSGTSIDRTLSVVVRHWGRYPTGHQRQLAQALVALLEPLLHAPPETVPESLREECARTVALWENHADAPHLAVLAKNRSPIDQQPELELRVRTDRAIKFLSVEVEHEDGEGCRARVQLERSGSDGTGGGGGFYQGAAELAGPDVIRCAAQATSDAITRVLAGTGTRMAIKDASVMQALGKRTVFVEVTVDSPAASRALFGFCLIDDDPARAAALAVLNATNRFVDFELSEA
jgi:hypothetical protein